MITVKPFSCKRDGLTIRGFEFKPAAQGKKFPTIVISHQFMVNQLFVMKYAVMFAKMGFCAYCYDFNGGGSISLSEGKTTDMTLFTEVEDLKAVVNYVKSRKYVDVDNFYLMGCSQGGFVSAVVAAELKKEIKKLILFYPALCMCDDARSGQMITAKFDINNVPDEINATVIKLGSGYVTTVLDKDPYDLIHGYTGPVLIVHGEKDVIVPYKYSVGAYEMYKADGADARLVKLPSFTHMLFGTADTVARYAVKQFILGDRYFN